MIKKAAFFLGLVLSGVSANAMSLAMYSRVMDAVDARDLKTLQQMVASGVNLNSPQINGMTPLCETVMRRDYQGYELLLTQGASPYVSCIRQLPQDQVAEFYANQPKPNTYYTGRMLAAHSSSTFGEPLGFPFPTLGVGEVLLGGVAAGAILTLGHGSSSSGGGGGPTNPYKWDAPLSLNPEDFSKTNEYKSNNIPLSSGSAEGVNFLGAINAADAYARGYTGYLVNRKSDGTLIGEGAAAITKNKVNIAVADDGVYAVSGDDLSKNVSQTTRYNYVYGVCSESNKAKCWGGWEASAEIGGVTYENVVYLYEDGIKVSFMSNVPQEKWLSYKYRYNDYYETIGQPTYVYNLKNATPVIFEEWQNMAKPNATYQIYQTTDATKRTWWASMENEADAKLNWNSSSNSGTVTIGGDTYTFKKTTTDGDDHWTVEVGSTSYDVTWDSSKNSGTATINEGEADEKEITLKGTDIVWHAYDGTNAYEVDCLDEGCGSGIITINPTTGQKVMLSRELTVDSHGTEVSGVAVAENTGKESGESEYGSTSGMMGVAYNAQVIPVKLDMEFTTFDGLKQAVVAANKDIVNVSIGTTEAKRYSYASEMIAAFDKDIVGGYPHLVEGYRAAASSGTIMVFSAGNYEHSAGTEPYDSSLLSAAPLSGYFNGQKEDEYGNTYNLQNLFVNVVALNSSNELASYSAKCGATKDYCIAAPGGDVDGAMYSTSVEVVTSSGDPLLESTYAPVYGTSFAAPIVSGSLAVIKGAFPHLTNQQVVQILFETATDLGVKGVDETYGHGLVNLEAATSPIGLPNIVFTSSATGASAPASSSSSTVPSSFSGLAKALPTRMIVLDKYQRAFSVPTSSFVHVAKRENKLEGHFKSFMSGDEKVVANTDTFQMAYSDRHSRLNSQMKQGSVRFEVKPSSKWSFKSFYTENTETSGGTYFERLMMSPYGKMKEAWGSALSYDLTKNWHASVMGQVGKNGFMDEDDLHRVKHNKISLFQSSLQYNGLKRVGLKVTAGVANEQGSTLGMWGKGAFKTGNSRTDFVGAGVTLNLTDALTIEGMYYRGTTKVGDTGTLIKMSDIKSDSFALTAAWKMNEARTLGLQFSSPLRVAKGVARVSLPTARDAYQDFVYRDVVEASLKPTAREYDVGLYYTDAIKKDVHFQSELGVRLNPDHVADAAPDWRALIGLKLGL